MAIMGNLCEPLPYSLKKSVIDPYSFFTGRVSVPYKTQFFTQLLYTVHLESCIINMCVIAENCSSVSYRVAVTL